MTQEELLNKMKKRFIKGESDMGILGSEVMVGLAEELVHIKTIGKFIEFLANEAWDASSIICFIVETVITDGPVKDASLIPDRYDS